MDVLCLCEQDAACDLREEMNSSIFKCLFRGKIILGQNLTRTKPDKPHTGGNIYAMVREKVCTND